MVSSDGSEIAAMTSTGKDYQLDIFSNRVGGSAVKARPPAGCGQW
jgi:hypothetical protein